MIYEDDTKDHIERAFQSLLGLNYPLDPRCVHPQTVIDFPVACTDAACTVHLGCSKVEDRSATVCILSVFRLSFRDNLSCRPSRSHAIPPRFLRSFPSGRCERFIPRRNFTDSIARIPFSREVYELFAAIRTHNVWQFHEGVHEGGKKYDQVFSRFVTNSKIRVFCDKFQVA